MNPDDDDEIHPWNGHNGTPQDRLAAGCAWIIYAIPVVAMVIFLTQLAEHWWKGTL